MTTIGRASCRQPAILALVAAVVALTTTTTQAFQVPQSLASSATVATTTTTTTTTRLQAVDPQTVLDGIGPLSDLLASSANSISGNLPSSLMAFADQGQNLAGIFFQASLLPYLLFLYFLSFRSNRIPNLGNYGFQFVLLFVISTIPSGIISKSVYGLSLANTDWLHGGAELLLTVANILIVLGFKEAMTTPEEDRKPLKLPRQISLGAAALFAVACAAGPSVFQGHTPFLAGVGNLSPADVQALPWVSVTEPVNALSIPTWAIHFSSVLEYLVAMELVWQYSQVTGNEKWKGLTWGMLPLHASGICACTYHFFYNPSSLQFLVTSQAGLTLLGNVTCMIAAIRIALSNGWTFQELIPSFLKNNDGESEATGAPPSPVLATDSTTLAFQAQQNESTLFLFGKLAVLTVLISYFVKYGELAFGTQPFGANPFLAAVIIAGIPGLTAYTFYQKSSPAEAATTVEAVAVASEAATTEGAEAAVTSTEGEEKKPGLSFADVKKYGVAGTVAYVLTELAFWIVAFPVAGTALYQSTGHWPDVLNDNADRAAVLAFIFAGANIARLAVPLRLGAALALAPWVDENILSKFGDSETPPSTEA